MKPSDVKSGEIKILLVEDEPIAQKMAKMILEELNCELDLAANGDEAIELFLKQAYDLILMDIGLPDKDGISVTSEIRAIENKASLVPTPIVGLSVHTAKTARAQAMEAGMNGYFVKPITLGMSQGFLNQFVFSTK